MTTSLTVVQRFLTIFEDFRKFYKNCPRATQMFLNILGKYAMVTKDCQRLLKIVEDFQERSDDISTHTNKFNFSLRVKDNISDVISNLNHS